MSEQKLTQQEASAKISQLLREAEAKLDEAVKIADDNGVDFYWNGPTYGMGGRYIGNTEWNDSGCEWESSDEDYGWRASSQSC